MSENDNKRCKDNKDHYHCPDNLENTIDGALVNSAALTITKLDIQNWAVETAFEIICQREKCYAGTEPYKPISKLWVGETPTISCEVSGNLEYLFNNGGVLCAEYI